MPSLDCQIAGFSDFTSRSILAIVKGPVKNPIGRTIMEATVLTATISKATYSSEVSLSLVFDE